MGRMELEDDVRAHVLITDRHTHEVAVQNGFWGLKYDFAPESLEDIFNMYGRNRRKPYIAMLADMLGTRIGDTVFFYERQVGFHGVFTVKSEPFFDKTPFGPIDGSFPIRIEIECADYFEKPVFEDLVFSSREYESRLWTWFYRKVQGPRGINTINPEAAHALLELLVKVNGNAAETPASFAGYRGTDEVHVALPLGLEGKTESEDFLRAAIIHAMGRNGEMEKIFGPACDLEWFANNVPYHVTKKNIDILAFHKNFRYTGFPLRYQYTVVELKKGRSGQADISQVLNYSRWVAGRLAGGETETVQPVLVAHDFQPETIRRAESADFNTRGILLARYRVEGNTILLDPVAQ